ncbi:MULTISPECIES: MFS transporter [unclassified Sphingomonas]|uniref:MFS transporter n=1 Tax=unclassified Sphingomonas TaxID=196159 RepID=UPI00044E089C|nr:MULTISPECIES: MFS transporter [unclassified Sphingomonas]EZP54975.1 Major facilitator superfamily MFS_1 [Sphingomonas sp. RIT328]
MSSQTQPAGISPGLTAIFAIACGMMVANIYYAQALIGAITPALGLRPSVGGMIVTLTQLGYGAGLFFIVSLADRIENKRLILVLTLGACAGLVGCVLARSATGFLLCSFVTGFCSVGTQIMVPLAAHLAPEERRGQVVGNIMGGLITGIMLARPLANGLAALSGWRTVFGVSAVAMALLALLIARTVPAWRPRPTLGYGALLRSGLSLLVRTPAIRRRTAYQAIMFVVFNLFWTTVPLLLAQRFGFGQEGIALFALAGAGGALAAPIAGRLGDRGYIRAGTAVALGTAILAFLLAGWAGAAHALILLGLAAVLLDAATQLNQVLGQRVLFSIAPEARGRINSVYMTIVFVGGASGSMLATLTYSYGGWTMTAAVGAVLTAAAFLLFLTEPRG